MDVLKCVKTRRSKRLFTNKNVSQETINMLIEAAVNAPSSMDCQPWHFIVVKDETKKKKLADSKGKGNDQHILTAPITIIVCVDMEKSPSRSIEDGVCATQNLLLAAHNLGLGSVYISAQKETEPEVAEKIREMFNLPEKILPITLLPVGHPDSKEELDEKEVIKMKDRTHFDVW